MPDDRRPDPPRQASPAAVLGCALVAGVVAIALLLLLGYAWSSSGSHGHADHGASSFTVRAGPAVVITPAKVSAPARGMSAGAAGG
ncbi:hypothetical protein [Amycolatopsis sp. NPDC051903]|uniref:hypothetical protein n=1 Tax=Amycolatopsis sp. NPDC051903 TaxID=3363936 RepID=UPI0037ABA03E